MMKFAFALVISAAMLAGGEPQAKKTQTAAKTVAPNRISIPEGAVRQPDGRYFYTDSENRKWVFVRTPFGISRFEDKPGSATAPAASPAGADDPLANLKITESGGVVTFERKGPFGVSKWQKKKSELTEQESAALLRAQNSSQAADRSTKEDK